MAEEDPYALSQMSYKGHRLFNSLPQNIRNLNECDVTTFKEALDKFLETLPDQPLLPSLTQLGVCDTNSVDDWVSRLGQPVVTQNVTAAEIHWPQGHSSHDGLLMSSGIYTKSTKSKKTCLPKRPEMDNPSLVNVCVRIRPDMPCWSQPKVWLYNKQSAL